MQVAGENVIVPVDRGPREYATGEAILDASGIPVAYVVAEGDIPEFIADRFCTHLAYLNGIKPGKVQDTIDEPRGTPDKP